MKQFRCLFDSSLLGLVCCLGMAVGPAFAEEAISADADSQCAAPLEASALPRELRLRPEAAKFVSESHPEFAELIQALDKLYAKLDDNTLWQVSEILSRPEIFDPELEDLIFMNPVFNRFPYLLTETTAKLFLILLSGPELGGLDEGDLAILSVLARDYPVRKPDVSPFKKLNYEQFLNKELPRRMQSVFAVPGARDAVMSKVQQALPSPAPGNAPACVLASGVFANAKGPRKLRTDLSDEELAQSLMRLSREFQTCAALAKVAKRAHDKESAKKLIATTESDNSRAHEIIKAYVINDWGARRYSMAMLHIFGGHPLPISASLLREILLPQAKALLLPVKHHYFKSVKAELARSQRGDETNGTTAASASFNYRPVDFFEPAKEGKKSKAYEPIPSSVGSLSGESLEERIEAISISDANNDLRVGEITSSDTYAFRFLRDPQGALQQFSFRKRVVEWLRGNPELGQKFLDAVRLGQARIWRQAGIKLLLKRVQGFDGRIFEVKIPGQYRMLLIQNEGVWEAIDVVRKDDVDRAIDNLRL